jgi:hypothetical protein
MFYLVNDIVMRYRGAIKASAANTESLKEEITMTINRLFRFHHFALGISCFVLLTTGAAGIVHAQAEPITSGNWWSPSADAAWENGKFTELANRKKVYVVASFTDSRTISEPSPTRTGDVHRVILEALTEHKELQVVSTPSQADFVILVRAYATTDSGERPPNLSLSLDPSTVIAVDVLVLVPGSKLSNGAIHPRVVWEASIANAQVEAQFAARSTVDGFLLELSKLKEKPAAKAAK